MAEQREKKLFFTGRKSKNGKPIDYLESIPARDLSERDIRRLSDEQYEMVMQSSLYQKTEPASRKQETKQETKREEAPDKVSRPVTVRDFRSETAETTTDETKNE